MGAVFSSRALLALGIFTGVVLIKSVHSALRWRSRTHGRPLPPGPRPLPIIGNLLDVPRERSWFTYGGEMAQKYGDLIYLNVLGQSMLIVNNTQAAHELLHKRASNSSDRTMGLIISIIGADWMTSIMPYGAWWRFHRRLFWQHFHLAAIEKYKPVQREASRQFLAHLVSDPTNLTNSIVFLFSTIILKAVYNITVRDFDDPIIRNLAVSEEAIAESLMPGESIVELIPPLRFLPSWLPFQRRIAKWRAGCLGMKEAPYERLTNSTSPQEAFTSVLDDIAERLSKAEDLSPEEREDIIKNIGGMSYAAAAATSASTTKTFFLAMSLFPEVQKKAQAEIDTVIGTERLPDFGDEDRLPYVGALLKEVLRWHVVFPVSIPHATLEDEEYDGYFIPAGTTLVPNVWAMTRDPAIYPDPERFMPERYLKGEGSDTEAPDPGSLIFGFGRRICPGRYFAYASQFIAMASVLAAFDITPPLDADGQPIRVEAKMTDGFISHIEDSRCTIKPRSQQALELITKAASAEGEV